MYLERLLIFISVLDLKRKKMKIFFYFCPFVGLFSNFLLTDNHDSEICFPVFFNSGFLIMGI